MREKDANIKSERKRWRRMSARVKCLYSQSNNNNNKNNEKMTTI